MRVKNLDSNVLEAILDRKPERRREEIVDGLVPGHYIELRASSPGIGTHYVRYRSKDGALRHFKIGSTAIISLADARKAAKRLKAQVCLGSDPVAEAKARKAAPTYAEFFEKQYLPYAKLRKKSWARDEELYRLRIASVFGSRRIDQITRQQIQLFHSRLKEEGLAAASANHHIKLMKHTLYLAMDWGLLEKNVAARIPLFPELNEVEHYMDDEELRRLLDVLKGDKDNTICLVARWLLAVGCRVNEALLAKWEDIDLERRVFKIRAGNSKSGKLRSVPLSASAMEVLNAVGTRGQYAYVFVNRKRGEPYRDIRKAWQVLRAKANLPHLRLHDLRHQFASFLVNEGVSLYTVQTLLGHASPSVTMRYSHLSTKALQSAVDSVSVKLTDGQPQLR